MKSYRNPTCRFFWQPRRLAAAATLAASMTWVFGCGVGDYRERLEARVNELATTNEATGLYASQPLGNKPIAVSIPQVFKRPPLVTGVAVAEEGAPPDEVRVKPGVIDLPGLTYTYEEFVTDANGGQIPFYLYVGAEDKTQPAFRDRTSEWQKQVQERFPGQSAAWENVECNSPAEQPTTWRRLRVEGDQEFFYKDKDGKARTVEMPGAFEMYYRSEGDWAVVLAWRVPSSIAGQVNVGKWAPMVAGAVSSQAAQPVAR
jgi:hypothetical protein